MRGENVAGHRGLARFHVDLGVADQVDEVVEADDGDAGDEEGDLDAEVRGPFVDDDDDADDVGYGDHLAGGGACPVRQAAFQPHRLSSRHHKHVHSFRRGCGCVFCGVVVVHLHLHLLSGDVGPFLGYAVVPELSEASPTHMAMDTASVLLGSCGVGSVVADCPGGRPGGHALGANHSALVAFVLDATARLSKAHPYAWTATAFIRLEAWLYTRQMYVL